jgi:hypothetical protein
MGRPSPVDDESWRAEAAGAVYGDDEWKFIDATVSSSELVAVYDYRATSARKTVTLARDQFRSIRARLNEIHRQLGLRQAV